MYGDNINTDLIISGKYTKTLDIQELAVHCMEALDPDFVTKIKNGDFVVAGHNFGCGSSREQAALALKHIGVSAVLAKSFAQVFYRNAINIGLPVIMCDTGSIRDGDALVVDLDKAEVSVNDSYIINCSRLPLIERTILNYGGLAPFLKKKGDFILDYENHIEGGKQACERRHDSRT